jgi:hypothetical protein
MLKARRAFVVSAAVVLVLTAAVKLLGATRNAPYLTLPDPLFQLVSSRTMILLAAVVELTVAGLLILRKVDRLKLWLLVWLSSLFLSYRAGLLLVGFSGLCPCLGGPLDWFGVKPTMADAVAKGIIGYLLVFAVGFLLVEWRQKKASEQEFARDDCAASAANEN